ncbi:MAG: PAS domain S-box protein [Deltaproteobacteria bacterium]|nr:PAS domain S-box protein [Deltaproteobacteria bacterium]
MFNFAEFNKRHRSAIIEEWIRRLQTEVGEQYAQRPREELEGTVSGAFDADYHVMIHNDFGHINKFIEKITRMRLEAGFRLSDVQKAFELYRRTVVPLLAKETTTNEFQQSIVKINHCLAYTIHRFSDLFQKMHEEKILEHNRILEEKVRIRTAELRESQLKYKTLVEEITDGYFVVQDEIIVFANQAFCQMHDYEPHEVLGKTIYQFIAPESREHVSEIYRKSIRKRGAPRILEYLRLTRSGDSFATEILAKTTHYDNRLSNIGICRDITERIKMEERVREAERMAYIGQITTSLSHEIRNPLSAVKMNLQILKKNLPLRGNDSRRMDISITEVMRLEGILKELLDFAKPLQLNPDVIQVNDILRSSVDLLDTKSREEDISILTDLDSQMPVFIADGERLQQAFINLILNAMEASDKQGKIWVQTSYRTEKSQKMACIIIKDEGHGLPEEFLPEIFKPFFTTKTKGTGLGLTNVNRIVEAHHGWLEAQNRHPHGATFQITLPMEENHG